MAPELFENRNYGLPVDIWAIGVITCILLTGRPPFVGKSKSEISKTVTQDEPLIDKSLPP